VAYSQRWQLIRRAMRSAFDGDTGQPLEMAPQLGRRSKISNRSAHQGVVALGVAFEGPSLRAATTLAWRLAKTQKAVHWLEPMAAAAHRGGPLDSLRLREPARPIASAKGSTR
jgi:hypothetical protein